MYIACDKNVPEFVLLKINFYHHNDTRKYYLLLLPPLLDSAPPGGASIATGLPERQGMIPIHAENNDGTWIVGQSGSGSSCSSQQGGWYGWLDYNIIHELQIQVEMIQPKAELRIAQEEEEFDASKREVCHIRPI